MMISPFPSIPKLNISFLEHKYIWTVLHLSDSFLFLQASQLTHLSLLKHCFIP